MTVLLEFSERPSVSEWKAVDWSSFDCGILATSLQSAAVKHTSWSNTTSWGTACRWTMSLMNMHAKVGTSMVFLQACQCALFVIWSTNVTMQLWLFSEVSRSVLTSMPTLCQCPLLISSGCRKSIGLLLQWLVWWHKLQPETYCWVSRRVCLQIYQSFMHQ